MCLIQLDGLLVAYFVKGHLRLVRKESAGLCGLLIIFLLPNEAGLFLNWEPLCSILLKNS